MPPADNIHIFISHSNRDTNIAKAVSELISIALKLEPENIRCSSVDGHRLEAGAQIDESIKKELLEADVLIGLISQASIKSTYVLMELGARWGSQKPLIILLTPEIEASELRGPLSGLHSLRCDEEGQIHQMIKDIGSHISKDPINATYYHNQLNRLVSLFPIQVIEESRDSAFTFSDTGHLLAIGAHWDDLLLGCLGTMIKLKKIFSYEVDVVVLCTSYPHGYFGANYHNVENEVDEIYDIICEKEGFNNLSKELISLTGEHQILHDRAFRECQDKLISILRSLKQKSSYTLVLTPPSIDRNPDHRLTAEAAFSVFREPENLVLQYDIKRYTENPFIPSLCIGLDDEYVYGTNKKTTIAERKVSLLVEECAIAKRSNQTDRQYRFENSEHLFSEEALKARMFVNAQDNGKNKRVKYAEIFLGRVEI